jgi:hypothetical protein
VLAGGNDWSLFPHSQSGSARTAIFNLSQIVWDPRPMKHFLCMRKGELLKIV